jgi:hypothetical protein
MSRKVALWIVAGVVGTLVVLTIVAAAGSRTERLRKLVVATLEDRLDSNVELDSFSVDLFPAVTVHGAGLRIRLRQITDPSIPPLIAIDSFTVHCGIIDLLRRPRRFKHVSLEKLVINIPPGGIKGERRDDDQPNSRREASTAPPSAGAPPAPPPPSNRGRKDSRTESPIVVDELIADGALLRIIPRRADKEPKEFAIQALTMRTLGIGEQMPFKATLTNPIPKGLIETNGTFGPWQKEDPGATPLGGKYSFQKADLGTIKGIGGILNSTGTFDGELGRIGVKGTTQTPDFHVDTSKQPVALETTFEAVVDGTNGDTFLTGVTAKFLQTTVFAKGAVTGTKGVKGRTTSLDVAIKDGRIEDLLRLAVKGEKPLMVGRVALHTGFKLPPGERDVMEKLMLDGAFDVGAAQFTNPGVQDKLSGMSQRARGLDPNQKDGDVVSDLSGTFKLRNGSLSFTDLAFALPGAKVQLHGSFGLRSEAIDFAGTLRMDATISEAAGGGVKGFFLKAIDPLFKKKGAGALIPIRVGGTKDKPEFGLDVGRVFKSK